MKYDILILLFGWTFAGILVYGFFYDVIHYVQKATAAEFTVQVVENCEPDFYSIEYDGNCCNEAYLITYVCKI